MARITVHEGTNAPWVDRPHAIVLTVLRVAAALMLMQHGAQDYFGVPAPAGWPWEGTPVPFSRSWWAAVLQLSGGALLVMGLGTRLTAFVLSGLMAFAYFLVHAPRGFFPILNRGELAALYSFVFLVFAVIGGGPYSLDALIRRRSRRLGRGAGDAAGTDPVRAPGAARWPRNQPDYRA